MDALEEQVDLKIAAGPGTASDKGNTGHNPGLRALLSIKNFSAILLQDYAQLLLIEKELGELHKKGLLIIQEHAPSGSVEHFNLATAAVNVALTDIKHTLNTAKDNIEKKETTGITELWQQLGLAVKQLKLGVKNLISTGYKQLPETQFIKWESAFIHAEEPIVQSLVDHVNSCRVLLQMIEKYSPDELNQITKIIADQIPPDFTYEEAVLYQHDYYKALVNFKKEFQEEKNLWDKFLDILAGGTHQSPSERVMLERWIEGEKGDL